MFYEFETKISNLSLIFSNQSEYYLNFTTFYYVISLIYQFFKLKGGMYMNAPHMGMMPVQMQPMPPHMLQQQQQQQQPQPQAQPQPHNTDPSAISTPIKMSNGPSSPPGGGKGGKGSSAKKPKGEKSASAKKKNQQQQQQSTPVNGTNGTSSSSDESRQVRNQTC